MQGVISQSSDANELTNFPPIDQSFSIKALPLPEERPAFNHIPGGFLPRPAGVIGLVPALNASAALAFVFSHLLCACLMLR